MLGQDAALVAQAAGSPATRPSETGAAVQAGRTAGLDAVMQAACNPRPPVRVTVTPNGETLLNVNITAGHGALSAVRLERLTGATVEVPGHGAISTANVALPLAAGATTTTFSVRRAGAGVAGTVELAVVDGCGEWKTFVGGGTGSWLPAPSIASLAPASGPTGGGTTVTIAGQGFSSQAGATVVKFGQATATNVTCSSHTTCTAVSPAGSGTVDVTVTVGGRTSQVSSASRYTYTAAAAPTVTQLSPNEGVTTGGTTVTITGSGFATASGATTVRFGQASATNVSCASATTCTAVSPPGIAVVDVTVSVAGQTSVASSASRFSYLAIVTSISPTSGPVGTSTPFTLTGQGFSTQPSQTIIMFGRYIQAASEVTCSSSTICTGKTARVASDGIFDIHVSVGGTAISAANPAVRFTFGHPTPGGSRPTVSGLSPAFGPRTGGTRVTVTGTGFGTAAGGTAIFFGDLAGTSTSCSSATSCATTAPAGIDVVNVRAATSDGESLPTVNARFNYGASAPPPPATVSAASGAPVGADVFPAGGPAAGGNVVRIEGSAFSAVAGETTVSFGGASVPASCPDDRTCFVAAPSGSGAVDLRVTVQGRQSAASEASRYTFLTPGAAPTVAGITPSGGSAAGGTSVRITGQNFSPVLGATAFYFSHPNDPATGRLATNVTCSSTTTCEAVTPAAPDPNQFTQWRVSAAVAGTRGTTATTYDYLPAPTITALDRTSGPAAGGQRVTITGTNFNANGSPRVFFGPNQATAVSCSSATTCAATTPAGTDLVDVSIELFGVRSAFTNASKYKYPKSVTTPPAVRVSPTSGQVQLVDSTKLVATWSGLVTTGRDWVALHAVDSADGNAVQSLPINSDQDTGSHQFDMPHFPGTYQIRLFRDVHDGIRTRIATSQSIDVFIPLRVAGPTPAVLGSTTVAWWLTTGYHYQIVGREWVGLYEVGSPDGTWVDRVGSSQLTGKREVPFPMPSRAGTYEFRMFMNDTNTTGRMKLIARTPSFALTAPTSSWTACGDVTQPGAYLFSLSDYVGNCARFIADAATLVGTTVGDNTASSIRLIGGWSARVAADQNHGGQAWRFRADNINFNALSQNNVNFDNQASSIRVYPSNCGDGTQEGVYLYSEANYAGACTRLLADSATFAGGAVDDNAASSIKMVGSGWRVDLFDGTSYTGISTQFNSNVPDLGVHTIGHDRASSARVTRILGTGGSQPSGYRIIETDNNCGDRNVEAGIYLYTEVNFQGGCAKYFSDVSDLRTSNVHVNGQTVKSIWLKDQPTTTVTLFEDTIYGGKASSFVGTVNDLGVTNLGAGVAKSMRVYNRKQWDHPTNFDDLDVGIYWFRCGQCRYGLHPGEGGDPNKGRPDGIKAEPGQLDDYFSHVRPTLIYAHGNRPGSGRSQRETMVSIDGNEELASGWKGTRLGDTVWNVGVFYWNQFADDEQYGVADCLGTWWSFGICVGNTSADQGIPYHNEAKIWSSTSEIAQGMRWRKKDGSYVYPGQNGAAGMPLSVGDLFFSHYVTFFEKSLPLTQEVRLVGHSLGGQLVPKMAHWLKVRIYDGYQDYPRLPEWMMPKRIALVDPYYSDSTTGGAGGRPYLPKHSETVCQPGWGGQCHTYEVHNGTGYEVARLMREMKQVGTVFEYYHFTDQVAPRHKLVADEAVYTRVRVDFVMTMSVPAGQDASLVRQFGWAHMEAPVWYLSSKKHAQPTEFRYDGVWPFGGFVSTGGRGPSASMSTADLYALSRGCNGQACYWWDSIGLNQNRTPSDDQWERKNR